MPPFFVISEATYPMRRMLMSRCSFENPNSDERCLRTRSPSSKVTGRPPTSRNFVIRTLAMVDLPARKSGEEDGHTLLRAWREAAPQFLNYLGIGEPRRNVAAFIQPVAQFGAGDIQNLVALLDLVVGDVAVLVFEVHHHAERHHGDADVGLVLLKSFLGLVGTIEGLAVGVFARAGVIAAHDEVGAAVVLANQGVPDRFARSTHAHGKRQERELLRSLWILRAQQLVAAHAGVVVHVSGLRHSDDGMDQKVGFHLLGRAESEFHVGAVHGVASLEGNDSAPSKTRELRAQLCRGEAQRAEIVMRRMLQTFDAPAYVPRVRLIHRVVGAGMSLAGAVK